jgi:hypothetical protein
MNTFVGNPKFDLDQVLMSMAKAKVFREVVDKVEELITQEIFNSFEVSLNKKISELDGIHNKLYFE